MNNAILSLLLPLAAGTSQNGLLPLFPESGENGQLSDGKEFRNMLSLTEPAQNMQAKAGLLPQAQSLIPAEQEVVQAVEGQNTPPVIPAETPVKDIPALAREGRLPEIDSAAYAVMLPSAAYTTEAEMVAPVVMPPISKVVEKQVEIRPESDVPLMAAAEEYPEVNPVEALNMPIEGTISGREITENEHITAMQAVFAQENAGKEYGKDASDQVVRLVTGKTTEVKKNQEWRSQLEEQVEPDLPQPGINDPAVSADLQFGNPELSVESSTATPGAAEAQIPELPGSESDVPAVALEVSRPETGQRATAGVQNVTPAMEAISPVQSQIQPQGEMLPAASADRSAEAGRHYVPAQPSVLPVKDGQASAQEARSTTDPSQLSERAAMASEISRKPGQRASGEASAALMQATNGTDNTADDPVLQAMVRQFRHTQQAKSEHPMQVVASLQNMAAETSEGSATSSTSMTQASHVIGTPPVATNTLTYEATESPVRLVSHGTSELPEETADQIYLKIRQAVTENKDHITLRLQPAELGRLDIRMQIDAEGRTQMLITADNRDTFEMLQRDIRGLERTLHEAGLKTDSDSLQFDLKEGDQQAGHEAAGEHAGTGTDGEHRMDESETAEAEASATEELAEVEIDGEYRLVASQGIDLKV